VVHPANQRQLRHNRPALRTTETAKREMRLLILL
jgi:hypothetical protein